MLTWDQVVKISQKVANNVVPRWQSYMDADDLVQVGTLAVFQAVGNTSEIDKPTSFVWQVSRRAMLSELRSQHILKWHHQTENPEQPATLPESFDIADSEDEYLSVESTTRIDEFIARLSQRDRQIVELYREGLSTSEVSIRVNLSQPRLRNIVLGIRRIAAIVMDQMCEPCDYPMTPTRSYLLCPKCGATRIQGD